MIEKKGERMDIVDRVISAYQRLNIRPRRGVWIAWSKKEKRPVAACGLGVLLLDSDAHAYQHGWSERAAHQRLGLGHHYIKGFTYGFDSSSKREPSIPYVSDPQEFSRGFADGRRAQQATRRWKHRETIRLGLETLGAVCAFAAREAGIVDRGIAAVRELVRTSAVPLEA